MSAELSENVDDALRPKGEGRLGTACRRRLSVDWRIRRVISAGIDLRVLAAIALVVGLAVGWQLGRHCVHIRAAASGCASR